MRSNQNRNKLACKRGHALTPENVYLYPSKTGPQRFCRVCRRMRHYAARKRAS